LVELQAGPQPLIVLRWLSGVLHYDRIDWGAVDALANANGIADAAHTVQAEAKAIARS